jgi:hypothetical protein
LRPLVRKSKLLVHIPRQVFNESVPWNKSRSSYDSCVDKVPDPQIFVIFDRNQCYPEYLFMYTDRDTVPDPYPTTSTMQSASVSPAAQLSEDHRQKGDTCVIQ